MRTITKNKFFRIVEINGAIISLVRNDSKSRDSFGGGMSGIRNAHYDAMRSAYPEIEHPVLARFLNGCTPVLTRYIIPLSA